jgi:hypothetical protein
VPETGIVIGLDALRPERQVALPSATFRQQTAVLGATGTGKSTAGLSIFISAVSAGLGGLLLAEAGEQERVSLLGRVGADPTFRTTPKGTLVGRFPLAVHGEGNSTTWYPVLAFNQRAERLKEGVHKGEAVRVVGYVHEREIKTRDGEPRTVREVYAVSVTPPSAR